MPRENEVLSPLDGRYAGRLKGLLKCAGDGALARYRVRVECRYLEKLCDTSQAGTRKLKPKEKAYLQKLHLLTRKDQNLISTIETTGAHGIPPTKHDVKAVEYFIRLKLSRTSLKDIKELVHCGLTSEDVNNIAYALMLRDCLRLELLPALNEISAVLEGMALRYAASPLLARTHGQPAVPTTFGKELRVFQARLSRQIRQLEGLRLYAKLNGAVGNYNAHAAAFPRVDWRRFSREFVESFNEDGGPRIVCNALTTQIEPHDSFAEAFDTVRRANVILLDLCGDMWRYISDGLVTQKAVTGEIGSSTMPQKVNPIHFENAEGNLGVADALFGFFSSKLPVSRLQRDLSDSTVLRNIGVALGHSLMAYASVGEGLSRVAFAEAAARAGLEAHPEIVAEGMQTILRREGATGAYEKLAALTRGRRVTLAELHAFIGGLSISASAKKALKELSPLSYLGLSEKLAAQKEEK